MSGSRTRSAVVATGLLAVAAGLASPAFAQEQRVASVERGRYLVNTIMVCGNCHTPKGPNGDIADKAFSGFTRFTEAAFDVTAPNITPDKETGIGNWSDADIKKALLDGMAPNGVHLSVIMPTGFYGILLPGDLDAIVAYLRTVTPVKNKVPDPIYRIAVARQIYPGAEKPIDPAALKDKVGRGFYLSTIGHCMECHTPDANWVFDYKGSLGKGGRKFPGPWGVSVSANITSSKTKGLGAWTDAEIKRAITEGIDKDGHKLKPPMGFRYLAHLTDADLDDLVAWLRTVPPQD
jgi:mono/diheme cytochrome c family protein